MTENTFLSDIVRKQYLALENARNVEIDKLMTQYSMKRDQAELWYYRMITEQDKLFFQKAVTRSEFYNHIDRENFEFEGHVVEDDKINQILFYAHGKQINVDGVPVCLWAEEGDAYDGYECTSPDNIKRYRIIIKDYLEENRGIDFVINFNQTWTKNRIMEEFDDIIDRVRRKVDFGYFEGIYGKLNNVVWLS